MTETTQHANVVVPDAATQIAVPQSFVSGGGIIGAVVAMLTLFLAVRKRWSRDNLELTKDRAETNLIATLEKTIADLRAANERLDQNARDAWRTRAEDAKRIGELTSKVGHLEELVRGLKVQNSELTALVRRLLPESERHLFDQSANRQSEVLTMENVSNDQSNS